MKLLIQHLPIESHITISCLLVACVITTFFWGHEYAICLLWFLASALFHAIAYLDENIKADYEG
jgi:hypothetical protein